MKIYKYNSGPSFSDVFPLWEWEDFRGRTPFTGPGFRVKFSKHTLKLFDVDLLNVAW